MRGVATNHPSSTPQFTAAGMDALHCIHPTNSNTDLHQCHFSATIFNDEVHSHLFSLQHARLLLLVLQLSLSRTYLSACI